MNVKPDSSVPPEIALADRYLRSFPKVERITAADLVDYFTRQYPAVGAFYLDYHTAALEVLIDRGYVTMYPGDALSGGQPRYGLTQEGRDLKAEGSFSQTYLESKRDKALIKKATREEGHKKIWDNRSKYFMFSFAALGAAVIILGLWASHGTPGGSPAQAGPSPSTVDSSATATPPKKDPSALSARKHHPKTDAPAFSGNPGGGASTARNADPKTDPAATTQRSDPKTDPYVAPPRPAEPLQSTTTDNIEFKLLKAQGNTRTQSITMTLVLTTSAADHTISSDVRSIIDDEGNEYNLKSHTIGSSTFGGQVDLVTGVPLRCTFTFGGILPEVKRIKLFNYIYYHSGGNFHVEFRDIPIDWR